jgi:DNA (cytosine-5)-methyltransferase 1
MSGIVVDSFAGGGGASTGIEAALGRSVDIAVNHDGAALAMHRVNHPGTLHFQRNVWQVDPADVVREHGPISLAWFSPDCTHHSKAKGGKPREQGIRDLAWVVVLWAQRAKPDVIMLENVEEFRQWGPLTEDGYPCKVRAGSTFDMWRRELRRAGYKVEHRELRACDYGAPTIRKRLFVIARRDGLPIVWPEPTHGPGRAMPWRTAAECIDWTLPCPSIFLTREQALELRRTAGIACNRPLAEATMRRIAKGLVRYVLESPRPYIVPITNRSSGDIVQDSAEPLRTVTASGGGEFALATPYLTKLQENSIGQDAREPIHTVMAGAPRFGVVSPYLVPRYGEREGQEPRALSIEAPMPTIVPTVNGGSLVAAFMAQHNTGVVGHDMTEPMSTIVGKGCTQGLVAAHLLNMKGSDRRDAPADAPLGTVTAQGGHASVVAAFLQKYYGTGGQDSDPSQPMHTVTALARHGLVTVTIDGQSWVVVDIGMRMLTPRELFRAQGFPESYVIDRDADGNPLSKATQIRLCGNSVCPPLAEALVAANCSHLRQREAA